MSKGMLSVVVLSLASVAVQAADGQLDYADPKGPLVTAFHESRCAGHADAQGLTGDARAAFVQNCRLNADKVWPFGVEQSKGGD